MTDHPWPAGELAGKGVSALRRGRRPFGLPGRLMRNTRYTRTRRFRAERAAAGLANILRAAARTDGPAPTSQRALGRPNGVETATAGRVIVIRWRSEPTP
jgi:hypothetical protein